MVVHDIVKDRPTLTVNHDETVLQVAQKMVDANVGAVPVMRAGELFGIFSERDLMRRIVVEGRNPARTRVAEVASLDIITVPPGESVEKCMFLMKQHGIRHLPICDGRRLLAIISLRDLLLHDVAEKDGELQFMREYMRTGT